ncbi:MAG: ABC transporter permease [Mesorhizobium sp.]|nr:MAG: ABC transporter permease [Mesorhizobium sp.]
MGQLSQGGVPSRPPLSCRTSPPQGGGLALIAAFAKFFPAALAFALLLLAWELYARLGGIAPTVLPAPSRVLAQAWENRAALADNTLPTIRATLAGFACSLAAAFVLSALVDFLPRLRRALFPLLIASQTLPLVAIAPLVVLWFGFGLLPKILLVALVTFFPMMVALVEGYAATSAEVSQMLAAMGAGRWRIFWLARLPSGMPYFFAGLRISITYAVVGAIFAEYAGAAKGLGIYMLSAKNNFRPDLVLAAVAVSSALTLALFGLAVLVQRLAMPWERAGRDRKAEPSGHRP